MFGGQVASDNNGEDTPISGKCHSPYCSALQTGELGSSHPMIWQKRLIIGRKPLRTSKLQRSLLTESHRGPSAGAVMLREGSRSAGDTGSKDPRVLVRASLCSPSRLGCGWRHH